MASRVNTKFVVGLSVVVLAFFGAVGFVGMRVVKNSPEKLVRAGDEKVAAGDFKEAEKLYAKAVNKAQTNIEYMKKWKGAMTKSTYGTRVAFDEKYGQYVNLMRQMAAVQRTDLAAHQEYIGTLLKAASRMGQRNGYDAVERAADEAMNFFKEDPAKGDSLRRYRGIAAARIMALTGEMKPEEIAQATEDLQRALKLDPKDGESAEALVAIHQMRADAAKKDQRIDDMKAERQARDAFVAEYIAANPNEPRVLFQQLRTLLESGLEEQVQGKEGDAVRKGIAAVQESMKPALAKTALALEAASPDAIDVGLLSRFQNIEGFVEPTGQNARTEAILRKQLEKSPDNVEFMLGLANVLADRRAYADAVAIVQKISDLPDRPIGVEGLLLYPMRTQAQFYRTTWQVKAWGLAKDADKAAALAKAKEYRDALKKSIDETSPEALFVDAQIAFAEKDWMTADKLISKYNQARRDSDPEGVWLAAQVKLQKPSPETGAARDLLRRLVSNEMQPGNWTALVTLGQIEASLQNYQDAMVYYKRAQELKNDDEEVNKQVRLLNQLIKGETLEEDVPQYVMKAQKMKEANEPEEKILAYLREGVAKTKDDPRMVRVYVGELYATGDREKALAFVREELAKKADSKELKAMELELSNPDPMQGQLVVIDNSEVSDLEKASNRYRVYMQYGKRAEAKVELAKAAALAPNDPVIIEQQFVLAVDDKDMKAAAEFADRATKANADKENGDTFRARLEIAKGDAKRGVQIIEEVIKRGNSSPEMLRLLGRAKTQAGDVPGAVEDFRKALAARPNDMGAGTDLINALIIQGDREGALSQARAMEKFGRSNDSFVGLWLNLEGAVGDKEKALDLRQRLVASRPTDRANRMEIAGLLIDLKRWDDAKKQIGEIRKLGDGLDLASMEASLYNAQSDTDKARGVFEAYIAAQDQSKIGAEPYLALGRYLFSLGNADAAIAAYEKGRAKQDPKTMQGDIELSDAYYRLGASKENEMVAAARRVIDGGADVSGNILLKRVIDSEIRHAKYDEALKDLEMLKRKSPDDATYYVLLSDIRLGKKDEKGARAALDEATTKYADNPLMFMKRAQFLSRGNDTLRDAKADLDKVLRLSPNSWQAYQMRAYVNERMNKPEETILDMRAAVRAAPQIDDLRERVMNLLLSKDRADEAAEVARESVKARPRDTGMMLRIAQVFQAGKMNDRAIEFLRQAYQADPTTTVVSRYINALLDLNPAQIAPAEEALQAHREKIASDLPLALARARVLYAKNKNADAATALQEAAKLIDVTDPGSATAWYNVAQKFMPDSKQMLPFLESLEKAGVAADWMAFYRANVMFNDTATRDQGISMLRGLTDAKKPRPVRLFSYRALGSGLYALEKYGDAEKAWRDCLDQFPDDFETINNLAYTLAKHLKKADEALPFAEKAAKMRPNIPEVLDTLGFVQMEAGKLEDAKKSLTDCVVMEQTPRTLITALSHLLDCSIRLKDETGMKEWLKQLDSMIQANPKAVSSELKDEIEVMRKQVK